MTTPPPDRDCALGDALAHAMIGFPAGPADNWQEKGWTADRIMLLADLARWAAEHQTALAVTNPDNEAFLLLVGICESCPEPGTGAPDVARLLPWLAVFCAAPDRDVMRDAYLLTLGQRGATSAEAEWRALGPVGAVAFAAGLSIDEVTVRAGQTPTEGDDLVILAGLRGWPLPPVLTERLVA